jgi:hypothetical protein
MSRIYMGKKKKKMRARIIGKKKKIYCRFRLIEHTSNERKKRRKRNMLMTYIRVEKYKREKKGHVTHIRKKRTLSERQREVLVHAIFFKYS